MDRAGRLDLIQEAGRCRRAYLLADTAGDQLAQQRAAGR